MLTQANSNTKKVNNNLLLHHLCLSLGNYKVLRKLCQCEYYLRTLIRAGIYGLELILF